VAPIRSPRSPKIRNLGFKSFLGLLPSTSKTKGGKKRTTAVSPSPTYMNIFTNPPAEAKKTSNVAVKDNTEKAKARPRKLNLKLNSKCTSIPVHEVFKVTDRYNF